MGFCFNVYAMDLDYLRKDALNPDRWEFYCNQFKIELKRHDDFFANEIEDGDPTLAQALYKLLNRESGPGYALAYALEIVVMANGVRLRNDGLSAMRYEWVEQIDSELALNNIAFRLGKLYQSPVDLPVISDFPMVGFATRDELAAMKSLAKHADEDVESSFSNLRAWASQPLDIVSFYY